MKGELSEQIKVANEKLLQARNIEKLDAQTIALLAMTNKTVGIYANLQDQINKRLVALLRAKVRSEAAIVEQMYPFYAIQTSQKTRGF